MPWPVDREWRLRSSLHRKEFPQEHTKQPAWLSASCCFIRSPRNPQMAQGPSALEDMLLGTTNRDDIEPESARAGVAALVFTSMTSQGGESSSGSRGMSSPSGGPLNLSCKWLRAKTSIGSYQQHERNAKRNGDSSLGIKLEKYWARQNHMSESRSWGSMFGAELPGSKAGGAL